MSDRNEEREGLSRHYDNPAGMMLVDRKITRKDAAESMKWNAAEPRKGTRQRGGIYLAAFDRSRISHPDTLTHHLSLPLLATSSLKEVLYRLSQKLKNPRATSLTRRRRRRAYNLWRVKVCWSPPHRRHSTGLIPAKSRSTIQHEIIHCLSAAPAGSPVCRPGGYP